MMCGELMEILYPKALETINSTLIRYTGKAWNKLDPNEFYDIRLFSECLQSYSSATKMGTKAISVFGRHFYPTIQSTYGIPPQIKTITDHLKYESEMFIKTHQGVNVEPRKITAKSEKEIQVLTKSVGYDPILFQGVFIGVFQTIGIRSVVVTHTKRQVSYNDYNEFKITW